MNRRDFLKRCLAGAGGAAAVGSFGGIAQASAPEPGPKLNVLWLVAEDLCPDLGCYGQSLVRTPHCDGLAAEGTRFSGAFATAPVCSPSRSAFMTAMYQTSIGAHQHRTVEKKPLPAGVRVITDHFREAGYFTSSCQYGPGFDRRGKTDFNFTADRPFVGTDWRQRKDGQPFFSLVQFSETHRNFKRDRENPIDPEKVDLPPYYPDHPLARRDWADYLECVQVLDRKVGEVLERLESDGLAESTMVVFFADHGRPHVRGKQFLYEGGIHVPLIIRWPGRLEPGGTTNDLVSLIDLGPACLKAAGVEPPAGLHGRDFLAEDSRKRQFIVAARDRCDETFDRIRCVRTKRFKYIRNFYPHLLYTNPNLYKKRQYPVLSLMEVLHARGELTPEQARFMACGRPFEELYDLEADPHEVRNLAGDAGQKARLAELRAVLDSWIEETGDMAEIPEDPAVAASCFRKRHFPSHRRTMKKRGLSPHASPKEFLEYWERTLLGKR